MNSDLGNPRGVSARVRHQAAPSRPRFIALLLFAITGGDAGSLPAQAAPDSGFYLALDGDSALGRVCAGDSLVFKVLAEHRKAGVLPAYWPQLGVIIEGAVEIGYGALKPVSARTSRGDNGNLGHPPWAAFTFTARLPGGTTPPNRTRLRFAVLPRTPNSTPYLPLTRVVEIVPCDAQHQAAITPVAAPVAPPVAAPEQRSAAVRNPAVRRISRVKVNAISTWNVGMEVFARIDDGVMDADDQGHFTGSASVVWQTSVIGSAGCGAAEHPVAPSRAALTGEIDASNQLVVRITFEPRDFSGIATCYVAAVRTSNVATPNPLTITVPLTGGTSTQPHPVTAKNGTFVGSATIVVTPEPK